MNQKEYAKSLVLRYLIIALAGLNSLYIFYKVLTPITMFSLNLILNIFSKAITISTTIFMQNLTIEIIEACIAGAAFYFLFILNLSIPNIKPKKRLIILAESFLSLFILNILRILFLILISGEVYFETVHLVFWHLISTIFVVGIYLYEIKKHKIKEIPIYSDIMFLLKIIKGSKDSKRKKKNKK